MSLLKRFLKEQYNRKFIEREDGFLVYSKYDDNSVYVQYFYVVPEKQNLGIGRQMVEELIDKEKPTILVCEVDYANKDCVDTVRKFHNYGFSFLKEITNAIVLYKVL